MANNMDKQKCEPQSTLDKLEIIINHYRRPGDGIAATLRVVAACLAMNSGNHKLWTWNYIHQVRTKALPLSQPLSRTIHLEYNKISKSPSIEYEVKQVFAPAGFLSDKVYVTGRPINCEFCLRQFIPSVPTQRFCTPECQKKNQKKKR
jgi:hypothetical protein